MNTEIINNTELQINSVNRELTMDLVLIEEFYSSQPFTQKFLENIFNQIKTNSTDVPSHDTLTLSKCIRSDCSNHIGETDITLEFTNGNKNIKILIENKINAEMQNNQDERYIERCKEGCKEEGTYAVIVAPKKYLEAKHNIFHAKVSYEDILSYIEIGDPKRSEFKVKLINYAINKCQSGYVQNENPLATQFWNDYYQYTKQEFDFLKMVDPRSKSVGAFTVTFPCGWENGLKIIHQMNQGNIHLLIPVQDRNTHDSIEQESRNNFLDDVSQIEFLEKTTRKTEKHTRETKIIYSTEKINIQELFCDQKSHVQGALVKAKKLYDFWNQIKKKYHYSNGSFRAS